jgi:hypothetical protein
VRWMTVGPLHAASSCQLGAGSFDSVDDVGFGVTVGRAEALAMRGLFRRM